MSARAAQQIQSSLTLVLSPVAISFADDLPDSCSKFEGSVPAGCAFWELAANETFATEAAHHDLCSIGVHTHNLKSPSANHTGELKTTLEVMQDLKYVRDEDVAAIPVLERQSRYVIYAPLSDAPLAPDVVVLFARAAESLIITEAVSQVDEGIAPAMGRPACAMVPQAANSGRAAMSLGCCGARAYLDALSDDVALWALPGARIEAYADAIVTFAKANRILTGFHEIRRRQVENGERPAVRESLARMQP